MGRRTLGIGVINFAYYLAKHGKRYSDGSANNLTHKTFEAIQYYLLKASNELAIEQGACPWFNETTYAQGIPPIDTYKKDLDGIVSEPLHYDWEALRESIKNPRPAQLHALRADAVRDLVADLPTPPTAYEPRGHVSIKASRTVSCARWCRITKTCRTPTSCCGRCRTTTVICSWWVSCRSLSTSRSLPTLTTIRRAPVRKSAPMQQLLKDLLNAYKFGVKTLYYHNTRDGAEDAQDDSAPSIQDDGCESGACKI